MTKSEEIKTTINAIRKDTQSYSEKALKAKYFDFYDNYPKLFDVAKNITFPLTYLDMMLAELDNLNTQKVDSEQADKNIYGHLRSIYVDPLVSVPDGAIVQEHEHPSITPPPLQPQQE